MAEPYTPEEEAELRAFVQKYPKMRWPTDDWITNRDRLFATLDRERERVRELERAILDIDAHASPLGEDADGFVSTGYIVSVGSLHRALGVVGHSAPKATEEVPLWKRLQEPMSL